MMTVRIVEYAYHITLKVEEKLARNKNKKNISRGINRGKGFVYDKAPKTKAENEKSYGHFEKGGSSQRRPFGGRNYFPRGRGIGRGGGVKCYAYEKTRHISWECAERKKEGGGC
jgi:hypothetical protein